MLLHFDRVSRTSAFEEMGRTNVDLGEHRSWLLLPFFSYVFVSVSVFEILRKR